MSVRRPMRRRLFQSAVALGVSGIALLGFAGSAQAITPINYWSSSCPTPNLHEGEGDGCVAYLQEQLNAAGYTPQLSVDGSFGPDTYAAVVWFQKRVDSMLLEGIAYPHLSVDGVAGVETRTDLDSYVSDFQP